METDDMEFQILLRERKAWKKARDEFMKLIENRCDVITQNLASNIYYPEEYQLTAEQPSFLQNHKPSALDRPYRPVAEGPLSGFHRAVAEGPLNLHRAGLLGQKHPDVSREKDSPMRTRLETEMPYDPEGRV